MKAELLKSGFQTITQATNSPVMFAVKSGVLYLGAHSETTTVVMTAPVSDADFHYVLPAEHIRQIAKTLKSGDVTILDGGNNTVIVQIGRAKFTYTTMDIGSISYKLLMHSYRDDFYYKVDGADLAKALQKVLAFSNSDVDDQRVKNLHFSIEGDKVEVVASNSFAIARCIFPSDENYGKGDITLRLVSKALAFMPKTFGTTLEFGFIDKKLYYKGTDDTFTYKVTLPVVDVPPFPYRDLFNTLETSPTSEEILLDRDEFLESGKNFLYFTDEDVHNRVKIEYTPDLFKIEGSNEKGMFDAEIVPVSSNATGSLYVSLDYLTKAANALESSEIKLKLVNTKILVQDNSFSVVVPRMRN